MRFKSIQKIKIDEIDTKDDTFSINFIPIPNMLRYSIKAIGLIQPVILRQRFYGYQIVCGFRRIAILKELGFEVIESQVFKEDEMDEKDFFLLSLHDNIMSRGFNIVEKSIIIQKLIERFNIDSSTVIQNYFPILYLDTDEKILNTYLSLSRMEEEVKVYVIREKVSHSNIRRFARFSPEDRVALIPFLTRLKLGENRLKEILTLLSEISMRDRLPVKEIIKRKEFESVVLNNELTPSQKTDKIKMILTNIRYPNFFKKEKEFEKKIKDLNIPQSISFKHSPYFEGEEFKVSFNFKTIEEYLSLINTLTIIGNKEEFKEIVKSTG